MTIPTRLNPPRQTNAVPPEWGQSLGDGAPGIALAHIARARAGITGWEPVHRLATAMTRKPVHAHPAIASLFRGAPAVAYTLHTAGHPAYRAALVTLDDAIGTLIRLRLHAAHRRIDDGRLPQAREYDLINGLAGLGVYLMHRHQDHELLRGILAYLVRLTRPVRVDDHTLPGWWAIGSPDRRPSPRWDGGHSGFGVAHGICGPLALLATAMRREIVVDGHADAIHTLSAWLEQWRTGHGRRTWWPEVIDRDELYTHSVSHPGPHRPSWCYNTPGIARALQLASLATGNRPRARTAEQALVCCLTDDQQLVHLTDAGLCHGWAGLVHTARRAADDTDTDTDDIAVAAGAAENRMRQHLRDRAEPSDGGLLEGTAGITLVETDQPEAAAAWPRWDACLLIG
ncbi:lanthionine synthetase C family protein [Candidatus Protofrankia californiensis]|uniref:Lanthionine synthetase C family protein n=1 Tax=Candidatus Protofrankia californiensis TaxID=1839754 RepID=A0A1C3P1U7_9ACTN|nr:lanthionine synthetase C family protein [Candidatus Protofrankia californiensis]